MGGDQVIEEGFFVIVSVAIVAHNGGRWGCLMGVLNKRRVFIIVGNRDSDGWWR